MAQPAPTLDSINPMGTDGFEFVEYTAPDTAQLRSLFEQMGFPLVARHRSKDVTLHRQGDVNFIVNAEPDSAAQRFARAHGPSVCAMAFRVRDAAAALKRAVEIGARAVAAPVGPMELNIPAIEGIGGVLIYFVDRYGDQSIYDVDFRPVAPDLAVRQVGLRVIDHLTHNVHRGKMDVWSGFYEKLFNFREIRYFDIEGQKTGPVEPGHDQSLRQDPHPDQRVPGRQVARSRSTWPSIAARASSTSRSGPTTSTQPSTCCAARGVEVPGYAGYLLRRRRRARARAWRESGMRCAVAAF